MLLIKRLSQALLGITEVLDWNQQSRGHQLDLGSAGLKGSMKRKASQFLLVLKGFHNRVGAQHVQIAFPQVVSISMVGEIDDQHVKEIFVCLSDSRDRAGPPLVSHERSGWAGNRGPVNNRTHGCHRCRSSTQAVTYARYRKDWTDAGNRVTRGKDYGFGRLNALDHAGRRMRMVRTVETNRSNLGLMTLTHKVFLEVQCAGRSLDHGGHAVVRHGQHSRMHPHSTR